MMNVWVQLIWITIVAIESFLYSIFKLYLASDKRGEVCAPTIISNEGNNILEFFTKFMEYQSWFIPLIWLYWPTKTNKKNNMRRVRAAKELSTIRVNSVQRDSTEKNSEEDGDGYTSLDGESYLDYDSQGDASDNDEPHRSDSSRGSTVR